MEIFLHPDRNREGPFLWGGDATETATGYWLISGKVPQGIDESQIKRWFDAFDHGHLIPEDLVRLWSKTRMGVSVARATNKQLNNEKVNKVSEGYRITTQITNPLGHLLKEMPVYELTSAHFRPGGELDVDRVLQGVPLCLSESPIAFLSNFETKTRFWLDLSGYQPIVLPALVFNKPYSGDRPWLF